MRSLPTAAESLTMVNGVWHRELDVADRGLNYGDGCFETMLWTNQAIPLLPWHDSRLRHTAKRLQIALQAAELEAQLADYLSQLAQVTDGAARGVIKLLVTRGAGGRGYFSEPGLPVTTIISHRKLQPRSAPVKLKTCALRLGENSLLAGLKHLNRLEYVLAAQELTAGWEGLLLSRSGLVVEALHHNIFWRTAGTLYTPKLQHCGVAGVMRQFIIEQLATRLPVSVEEVYAEPQQLLKADEVFICNAVRGIEPVQQIDDTTWTAGETTLALTAMLHDEFPGAFV